MIHRQAVDRTPTERPPPFELGAVTRLLGSHPVPTAVVPTPRGCGSRRREDAFLDEGPAQVEAVVIVHLQHGDGRAPGRRAAEENGANPAEVAGPLVAARVEEPDFLAGLGV